MIFLAFVMLLTSLQPCAAGVAPRTMAAIVSVESGGEPLAMFDNDAHRSYVFADRRTAESTAIRLLAAGHNVDLGLAQINSSNLASVGLTPHNAFDACMNVRAGAALLRRAYAVAVHQFGPGQAALRHALSAYNSGSLFAAPAYARRVAAAAGLAS